MNNDPAFGPEELDEIAATDGLNQALRTAGTAIAAQLHRPGQAPGAQAAAVLESSAIGPLLDVPALIRLLKVGVAGDFNNTETIAEALATGRALVLAAVSQPPAHRSDISPVALRLAHEIHLDTLRIATASLETLLTDTPRHSAASKAFADLPAVVAMHIVIEHSEILEAPGNCATVAAAARLREFGKWEDVVPAPAAASKLWAGPVLLAHTARAFGARSRAAELLDHLLGHDDIGEDPDARRYVLNCRAALHLDAGEIERGIDLALDSLAIGTSEHGANVLIRGARLDGNLDLLAHGRDLLNRGSSLPDAA